MKGLPQERPGPHAASATLPAATSSGYRCNVGFCKGGYIAAGQDAALFHCLAGCTDTVSENQALCLFDRKVTKAHIIALCLPGGSYSAGVFQ